MNMCGPPLAVALLLIGCAPDQSEEQILASDRESCAIFASVIASRNDGAETSFVSTELYNPALTELGQRSILGFQYDLPGLERREFTPLSDEGGALRADDETWRALEVASAEAAGTHMSCAPVDFQPAHVNLYTGSIPDSLGSGPSWSFSAPGVASHGEAIVFAAHVCGNLCGSGSYYLLRRDRRAGDWRVVGAARVWLS